VVCTVVLYISDGSLRLSKQSGHTIDSYTSTPRNAGGLLSLRQLQRGSEMEAAVNTALVKLKFHWDQFPRNFPVANVTGKSPTSYEEIGHVASLLRGSWRLSDHLDMSRWSGVSLTSS